MKGPIKRSVNSINKRAAPSSLTSLIPLPAILIGYSMLKGATHLGFSLRAKTPIPVEHLQVDNRRYSSIQEAKPLFL